MHYIYTNQSGNYILKIKEIGGNFCCRRGRHFLIWIFFGGGGQDNHKDNTEQIKTGIAAFIRILLNKFKSKPNPIQEDYLYMTSMNSDNKLISIFSWKWWTFSLEKIQIIQADSWILMGHVKEFFFYISLKKNTKIRKS